MSSSGVEPVCFLADGLHDMIFFFFCVLNFPHLAAAVSLPSGYNIVPSCKRRLGLMEIIEELCLTRCLRAVLFYENNLRINF